MSRQPFSAKNLFSFAYLYTRLRSLRSPRDLLQRVANLFVLCAKICTGRYGEKYWGERNKELLKKYLEQKDMPEVKDTHVHIDAGRILLADGKQHEAVNAFNRALALEPDNEIALFELGKTYAISGDEEKAGEFYRRSIAVNETFVLPRIELSKIYRTQGKLDLAEQEFKHVLERSPGELDILLELGKLYRLYRKDSTGEDLASVAERMDDALPGVSAANRDYYVELGKLYRESGDTGKAVALFDKILALPGIKEDAFLSNMVLNEKEIAERRLVLASKPRAMIAMILNRCNIKCRICEIWQSEWQESDRTMREIAGFFPFMEDICWQGGEVFMMKGFENYLTEASKYPHLKQTIFTNGLMLTEKIMDTLNTAKVDLVFSIDGATKETYEYIRRGGSFERLTKVLSMVREYRKKAGKNIRIYLNPVIMKTNYRELERLLEFGKEYEFEAVTYTPIRGDYGAENIFDAKDEPALAYIRGVMPGLMEKAKRYGMRLNNWIPLDGCASCGTPFGDHTVGAAEVLKGGQPANRGKRLICHAPWQRLLLDSLGQVRPFAFCTEWLGSTGDRTLTELWNGPEMQGYRRRIAEGDYAALCQPECISGQVREKICEVE